MWFNVVCTLIDNDMHHHSGQNVVRRVSPQQILTTVMTIRVQTTLNHIRFVFLPQYQRQRKERGTSVTLSATKGHRRPG